MQPGARGIERILHHDENNLSGGNGESGRYSVVEVGVNDSRMIYPDRRQRTVVIIAGSMGMGPAKMTMQ